MNQYVIVTISDFSIGMQCVYHLGFCTVYVEQYEALTTADEDPRSSPCQLPSYVSVCACG